MSVSGLDLETRLAIEMHPNLYVDATVRNDMEQFMDRFTDDAVFDASRSFPEYDWPLQGKEMIRAFSEQAQSMMELVCQQLHGVFIHEYTGKTAKVRYHLSEIGKAPGQEMEIAMGIYYDELVLCDDDVWRMNKHTLHPVYAYTPAMASIRTLANDNPRWTD